MGKAKRLRKRKTGFRAITNSAEFLGGLMKATKNVDLRPAMTPPGLVDLNFGDEEIAPELDPARVIELLGGTKPGTIFCEDCDDELTSVVEVDVDDEDSLAALFVAKCPKCESLSSQPCFTPEAAARLRACVIELNGTTAEQHSKISRDSLTVL